MDTSDKEINWDKLLAALDGTNREPLNAEEKAMLEMAQEVQGKLNVYDRFPVDEGWQRFNDAREARRPKIVRWRSAWKTGVAAAVLLGIVVTAGFWLRKQSAHQPQAVAKADLKPSHQVQLLSAGKVITLDSVPQTLQYSNGVKVQANANSVVYQQENEAASVKTLDTLVVPRGNKIRIALADGTGVWVNAATKLIYPTIFDGSKREVWLQGEAFFEVAANQHQPFIVHTAGGMNVKVLGTTFNINTYNTTDIQTTLASGKVSVGATTSDIILSPGEQAIYNEQNGALRKQQADIGIVTAWKDNNIYFEETPLLEITNSLGRSFDYDFKFEDTLLEKLSFTLMMQKPADLQGVLNQIHLSAGNITFRVQGRTVYISR